MAEDTVTPAAATAASAADAKAAPKPGSQAYRNRAKKLKKKNKFLANARGHGKSSGSVGRGFRLEGDEWTYFMGIMEVIKRGFEELDDKLSMAANVFEQTVDKEANVSANQIACTILEHLLPFTDAAVVERFQRVFDTNEYRKHCSDEFASHVLQKLVEVSFLRAVAQLQPAEESAANADASETVAKRRKVAAPVPDKKQYNLTAPFAAEHRQRCADYVRKISTFMLNNLEDFVWDQACHIMRTCVLCLGGVFVFKARDFLAPTGPAPKTRAVSADKVAPLSVPAEWTEVLVDYAKRLQDWPQFGELPYNELSSGLLQQLCVALNARNKTELKHLGKRLLNDAFCVEHVVEVKAEPAGDVKPDEKPDVSTVVTIKEEPAEDAADAAKLPKVFHHESGIRLLETLITTAGPKLLTQIYARLFAGNLVALAQRKSANFAVQKLLDSWQGKEEFEPLFDELAPGVEAMLRCGHTGVVNAMAQACLRLCCKQGAFVTALQQALHCTQPKERADRLAVLTIKLKPFEVAELNKSAYVHLHGSLILQAMLAFNKPIKLVQSMLDTRPAELAELFAGPCGSRVVDAFIGSKYIGEKSREKFIKHMNGTFLDLAVGRHGSRAVEAMFEASGDNQRTRIVKELAEQINKLKGSPTGRLLNYKFKVETYALSPVQWKSAFGREQKVEKLFKDII